MYVPYRGRLDNLPGDAETFDSLPRDVLDGWLTYRDYLASLDVSGGRVPEELEDRVNDVLSMIHRHSPIVVKGKPTHLVHGLKPETVSLYYERWNERPIDYSEGTDADRAYR